VLGPVEVEGAAAPADAVRGRDREVLVALALHHGETVPGRVLADLLWPGDQAGHGSAIKTYVLRLRKAFGNQVIDTVVGGYRLADDRVTVDAATFSREVQTACGDDLDCEGREEVDPRVAARGLGPGRLRAESLRIQPFDQDCAALRERVEDVIEQHDARAQECSQSGDDTHAVGAHVGEGGEAGGLLPSVAEDPRDRPGRQADRFGDSRRLLATDRVDGALQVSP